MNLANLLKIADEMYQCVQGKICFDADGWPIFQREHFLAEWPGDVITFDHKTSNLVVAPREKTLLCFYMGDIQNYRRFSKFLMDIPIYQQYMGVVVPDRTITRDMDYEMQEAMMLVNQLFAAVLVANNIKIVFNTRSGSKQLVHQFKNVPRHVMCASGFLGCENSKSINTAAPYVDKILGLMPDKLVIYGKHDVVVDNQLDILGIDYRYYSDFRTRSENASKMKRRMK